MSLFAENGKHLGPNAEFNSQQFQVSTGAFRFAFRLARVL